MWGSRVFRCASSLSQIHQHETHQHWNWSTSNASTWTPSTIVIHQQCNASTGNSSTGNPSTIEINQQCNPSTGIPSTGNPSTNVIYQQCNPSTGNPPTVGGFPVDGFPVDRLPVDRLHCWSITIVDGFPVDGFPVDALLVDQLHSWWSSCWWIWLSVSNVSQSKSVAKFLKPWKLIMCVAFFSWFIFWCMSYSGLAASPSCEEDQISDKGRSFNFIP